ncbi:MAG: PHB depolymerase family esterase [Pseudomonadota bacterium]
MMRILLIFLLLCPAAMAETFLGREAIVRDFRSDQTNPAPLILMLHGGFGRPTQMQRYTDFDIHARKAGVVVVYAKSARRGWHDGRYSNGVDDVGYLTNVVARLVQTGVADEACIFAFGHSNGGGMAMRLACDRPGLLAGIGVVATKALSAYPCRDGAAVPAIFIHGTADPLAKHEGREEGHRFGGTLSSDATMALWATRNGCEGGLTIRRIDEVEDETALAVERWHGCRAPVLRYKIIGGGHGWPGGRSFVRMGPQTLEMNAGAELLRFFLTR